MDRGKGNYRILNGPIMPMIGKTGMKPYNFKEIGKDSVEVEMYGQVVENRPKDWSTGKPSEKLYIVLSEFLQDLDTYKEKDEIIFRLNSVGGDLFAGIAIYNRMSELKGDTITIVDGLAASAASIILQGGKKRKIFAGSQVMVHGASIFMCGSYNRQELKKVSDMIKEGNESVLEIYASKTGKGKEFLRGLMEEEKWMVGKKAVENGFADELIETGLPVKMEMSADRKAVFANGIWMPIDGFSNIPEGIPIAEVAAAPVAGVEVINSRENKQKTGGQNEMDMNELREKYPELVKQIQQEAMQDVPARVQSEGNLGNPADEEAKIKEAVEAERGRLKAIEEIANQIADRKLVDEAKFGEKTMTAQELAFEAMRRQRVAGDNFMQNLKEDTRTSRTADVTPVPNCGTKTSNEEEEENIANSAALIARAWKE